MLAWAQVHFPIRRMPEVMENMLFDFDRIIDDSSFNKPPSQCTTEILLRCRHVRPALLLTHMRYQHSDVVIDLLLTVHACSTASSVKPIACFQEDV